MVAKLLLLQFVLFGCPAKRDQTAQNDFHRSSATPQIILLVFLVSPNPAAAGRLKVVLQPSHLSF